MIKKLGLLFKYNCIISTFLLSILSKFGLVDKSSVVELTRIKKAKKLKKKYSNLLLKKRPDYNTEEYEKTIWTCWFQGEENAPDIVKKCLDSIRNNKGEWNLCVITSENFQQYVDIPDHILIKWKKGIISNTHFSDILRCALLTQHGGIWMDATCFLTDSIPSYVYDKPFFCFKHKYRCEDTIELGSWFMFSCKNNPLLLTCLDLESAYWEKNNNLDDYFLFHIFMYISKDFYQDIWYFLPSLSDIYPHELNRIFNDKYDKKIYNIVIKNCFVQKMTYKGNVFNEGSFKEEFLKKE